MKNRVITISREFGSGGRTIGKRTAEKLGISRSYVSRIEKKALEKLRLALGEDAAPV